MRFRLLQILLILMLAAIPGWAQTSAGLDLKYGPPQQSYEIRPGIFMTAKYNADGQVCETFVERRHIKISGVIDVDPTVITADEMKEIVEELVPMNQRGPKGKDSSVIAINGVGGTAMDDYENVCVTSYFKVSSSKKALVNHGTVAIVITWKNRSCKSK